MLSSSEALLYFFGGSTWRRNRFLAEYVKAIKECSNPKETVTNAVCAAAKKSLEVVSNQYNLGYATKLKRQVLENHGVPCNLHYQSPSFMTLEDFVTLFEVELEGTDEFFISDTLLKSDLRAMYIYDDRIFLSPHLHGEIATHTLFGFDYYVIPDDCVELLLTKTQLPVLMVFTHKDGPITVTCVPRGVSCANLPIDGYYVTA